MRIIECDRCHARIQADKDVVGVASLTTASLRGVQIRANPFKGWDLCNDCYEEIRKFIEADPNKEPDGPWVHVPKDQPLLPPIPKGFKAVDVKCGAKIKRPIASGTKYAAVTPEKIEQIKSLAREGKTVKEIAEKVGVSDPTVRKYKAEVTNAEPDTEGDTED